MQSNFDAARAFVVHEEGPYTDDPNDSGNWSSGIVGQGTLIGSNEGVGAPAAISWMKQVVTAAWMKSLPDSVQSAIFRARYWTKVAGDSMPVGVDLMLVDHGYNRGPATAVTILQRVLCIRPDGQPGPVTISAIDSFAESRVPLALLDVVTLQTGIGIIADGIMGEHTRSAFLQLPAEQALIVALAAAQVKDYRQLKNFGRYGAGWLVRTDRRCAVALAQVRAGQKAASA